MKLLYRRCAALDVHKKQVTACIRLRLRGSKEEQIIEAVFGTFTADLERLGAWLRQYRVKQVAMESTGVYWIPVWNVLERTRFHFQLLLVNPATVRALRGAKTDRIDARRIAEYLQHGLLHGSFVPPRPVRELRDLTRMRVGLQRDRNRVINRIGRLLETANLKLGSVVSNIVGKTGCRILHAIADGITQQPERLAELACGSLRARQAELALALHGRPDAHFRWLLGRLLEQLEDLDRRLAELDARLCERMAPHADLIRRLTTIPGVDRVTAWTLLAELGLDMAQFPDAAHAASWAGLCPGNAESAGKRFSGKTRKGDRYLRRILVQNAWAVAHMKDCFLTALFYRTAHRRGLKKAAVAVAHRILIIAYHILRDGSEYREAGGDYFDRLDPERTARRLSQRLERAGFEVQLTRRAPAESAPQPGDGTRKRGRPCKCRERGIDCPHGRENDPQPRPCRSQPPAAPRPWRLPSPASPEVCRKCARWRVPCFHTRNSLNPPTPPGQDNPTT